MEPERPDVPRLFNFIGVGVGGSRGSPACGTTNPAAWTPQEGWQAMEPTLLLVRRAFGPRARIGLNIHHPYGVWPDHYAIGDPAHRTGMVFEQRLLAFQRCPQAQLRTNLGPLYGLFNKHGYDFAIAYLGAPRCDEKPEWPAWQPQPEHCRESFYRQALAGLEGFDCITYDALHHQNDSDSPVWDSVIRYTGERWLVGTESLPPRSHEHVLEHVQVVYVAERALQHREDRPEQYFTIEELQERGKAVVVFVIHPPEDYTGDKWRWQYERLLFRLREGRADGVGANLALLIRKGFDMRPVAEAAGFF